MYGNAYIENDGNKVNSILADEDPIKLAEFEARIADMAKGLPGAKGP